MLPGPGYDGEQMYELLDGSAVPLSMIERFENEHDVEVSQGWGMTELSSVGLTGRLNPEWQAELVGMLTYADQRALELGITIAGGAKAILLNKPALGMSRGETEQAVELIRTASAGKTLVMVEHDMGVVFDLADRITVLVYGEILASDTPAAIRADERVREAYLGSDA